MKRNKFNEDIEVEEIEELGNADLDALLVDNQYETLLDEEKDEAQEEINWSAPQDRSEDFINERDPFTQKPELDWFEAQREMRKDRPL